MLRRLIAATALTAGTSITAIVLLATPALAKGPTQARITGPGLDRAIVISGEGEPGQQGQLATLAGQTGLFTVLFGAIPGEPALTPLRNAPPSASLGPKYTLIYTLPGLTSQSGQADGQIRQDLYPRAGGGPVIYTPPGQPGYGGPRQDTTWLRGGPQLLSILDRLGVPPSAAHQAHKAIPPASRQAGSGVSAWLIATIAIIAAAALAGAALWLRHRRPTAGRGRRPRVRPPDSQNAVTARTGGGDGPGRTLPGQ